LSLFNPDYKISAEVQDLSKQDNKHKEKELFGKVSIKVSNGKRNCLTFLLNKEMATDKHHTPSKKE